MSAHVWVRDGNMDDIGGEVALQYAGMATFPLSRWILAAGSSSAQRK